jgi:hypothetical protein
VLPQAPYMVFEREMVTRKAAEGMRDDDLQMAGT